MRFKRSIRKPIDALPITQEARTPPYGQDWIVTSCGFEPSEGMYHLSGINLNYKPNEYGRKFFWRMEAAYIRKRGRGFDCRYNFVRGCTFYLLRHETEAEQRERERTGVLASL